MRRNLKYVVTLIIACSFGLFVFYSISNQLPRGESIDVPDLSEMIPLELSGWEVEDLPVGETEEIKQKMDNILNYDTAIFREYTKGLIRVQIYLSYWRPGKAHFRLVYGHTPDVCWVKGGWSSDVRDPDYQFELKGPDGLRLKTAQYREFVLSRERLYVMFWQLLDGEPFTYGNFGEPPTTAIFTDIFERGFDQKPEQWFIRISANREFGKLNSDKGFRELISSLKNFELEAEVSGGSQ